MPPKSCSKVALPKIVLSMAGQPIAQEWRKFADLNAWKALARSCALATFENVSWTPPSRLFLSLSSNAEVAALNLEYRGKNTPTNVLSFPAFDFMVPAKVVAKTAGFPGKAAKGAIHIGDIFLAFETILWEAEEYCVTFPDHVAHLIVHSILHLLGFDHIKQEDEVVMEQLEIQILNKLGIANPYE